MRTRRSPRNQDRLWRELGRCTLDHRALQQELIDKGLTCKQVIPGGTTKIADLNGPAFAAYFHTTCVPHDARAARDLYIRYGWKETQHGTGWTWKREVQP